eukprot:14868533-Ditylum_brightwellii.AAC.1
MKAKRIGDTIEWHTKNTTMPFISQRDQAIHAAKELTAVLNSKQTSAIFETPGDEQLKALKNWQQYLGQWSRRTHHQGCPIGNHHSNYRMYFQG